MERISAVLDDFPSQNKTHTEPQEVYVFPTSFAQQRLWLLDQLDPGSSLYNITSAVRLKGRLNVEALARTFDEIVRRHETLRTTFKLVDEMPVQVIGPPEPVPLARADLSQLAADERDRQLGELLSAEAARPFDLSRGPLLRVMVVRLGKERHVIILTMHHIISDGWSMAVLEREVGLLYGSYSQGMESPLAELEIQYADYAMWQREWLQGEVLERELGYWREQLSGELPVLELPTDGVRPAVQTYNGAIQRFVVFPEVGRTLRKFSRAHGCTLYMTLLAAFQILLYRYSGQDEIVVGSPIAGRNRAEIEPLIGFFVNTLVLRTDLSGEPTFVELLGRVREVALGAYAHQDLPFEKLVEEIQQQRDPSRPPLFQAVFVLQNADQKKDGSKRKRGDRVAGLRMNALRTETAMAKYELTMSLEREGQGLLGTVEYNTDLFASATIERMIEHWQNILTAVLENPDQQINRIGLLSVEERQQLLVEWNETTTEYPRESCIHELFEAQVERTPEAVAVVFGNQRLTYAELNERANQLAHHLRSLGVAAETLVGLCVERSLEMVVGLLGILKAGGAYVSLDPEYPAERLNFMLEDAGISVLLTQQHLLELLPSHWALTFCLDSEWPELAGNPTTNPDGVAVQPENLAYVSYTSGSTGRPKGVSIPHRAVVSLLCPAEFIRLDERETMLQTAPLPFDASTFEIWGSLLNGARLVVMPPRQPTLEEIGAVLREQRVTTLWLTTGLFHLMVDEQLEALVQVKQLLTGGEVLSVEHTRRYLAAAGAGSVLINDYGPTESTTFTSCEVLREAAELAETTSVAIGKVIGGRRAYVVDESGELVGRGIWGELYIGGAGVARGYVQRVEETAARFVPDGWSGEYGGRLYRTGDIVRWRGEGKLEFKGRADGQVKLRGYRIEVGEIEAVLESHGGVRRAVVEARADKSGEKRLVGYVVLAEETGVDELREHLAQRLPSYMVPAAIILLKDLPLMPNGKIDRRALPEPAVGRAEMPEGLIAPRDSLEVQLLSIWEQVFNVSPISIRDNFFSLGGNSLHVVRLVSQIHARIGQDLPVAAVFENPTIDQLASVLRERNWPGVLKLVDDLPQVDSPLVRIQPSGAKLPLFFVSALGGILPSNVISSVLDLAPHLDRDQPFYGLQLPGLVQPLACHLSSNAPVDELRLAELFIKYMRENPPVKIIRDGAARCVEAMRQIQPDGPYHLVGFCSGGIVAFEIANELSQQGEEVGLLVLMDTAAPSAWLEPLGDVAPRASADPGVVAVNEAQVDPEAKRIGWFVCKDLAGSRLQVDLEDVYRELAMRSGDERWEYALELLKSGGEVALETTAEDIRRLFLIYNMNSDSIQFILKKYRPQPYSGKLTLFRINDFNEVGDDLSLGWSRFVSEPVDVQIVDGDHGTFFHGENLIRLAQRLTACLDEAQALRC